MEADHWTTFGHYLVISYTSLHLLCPYACGLMPSSVWIKERELLGPWFLNTMCIIVSRTFEVIVVSILSLKGEVTSWLHISSISYCVFHALCSWVHILPISFGPPILVLFLQALSPTRVSGLLAFWGRAVSQAVFWIGWGCFFELLSTYFSIGCWTLSSEYLMY